MVGVVFGGGRTVCLCVMGYLFCLVPVSVLLVLPSLALGGVEAYVLANFDRFVRRRAGGG